MISITNITHTQDTNTSIHYDNQIQNYTFPYKNDTQNGAPYEKGTGVLFDANSTFENTDFTNATSFEMSENNFTEYAEIPYYIKATSMTFCIIIMCLGVIGNVMVPIVILKTKDMRNSTNIFLVNLSIADLMVLLVCTPTVLVEVNSKAETWVLGKELCLAVPFVELTVAHASVLTILAISFERYYAICEPLRAGYVCTKTRAALICALAWFFAALFTSPILAIAEHHTVFKQDGEVTFQCLTQAVTPWQITFFVMVIIFLYILPLIILVILYTVIARNLISAASKVIMNKTVDPYNAQARKQVILMLGTVVLCFFLCLMPYRVLALWVIVTPAELSDDINPEKWYNILYFSRVMLYINSAINPILYNLMSSKFRIGFCKVCICCKKSSVKTQNRRSDRTLTNGSTTSSSLSRTTNSLKKLFQHRGSIDADNENPESNKEAATNSENTILNKVLTKKRFVRQQSAPVYNTPIIKTINRMKSEGDMIEVTDLDNNSKSKSDIERFIAHSDVSCKNNTSDETDIRTRNNSLRRSVLINSAKSNSFEQMPKIYVPYKNIKFDNVGFHKSKSIDCDVPESFV